MDSAPLPLPGFVATWGSDPLVVAARVDGPADAAAVLDRLRAEHPGTGFVTVVSVADAGALAGILDGLAPVLAERVFAPGLSVRWDRLIEQATGEPLRTAHFGRDIAAV